MSTDVCIFVLTAATIGLASDEVFVPRTIQRADFDGTTNELRIAGSLPRGIATDVASGLIPADCDGNLFVDLLDHGVFVSCITGPGGDLVLGCSCADGNGDLDIDLGDFAVLQEVFNPGPGDPVCGNGVMEGDEECDDGNTAPGDGCDSNCRVEAKGVPNDSCANAIPILDGETAYSNSNATTDGPAEPSCNFPFDDPQVGSDVWFVYESTCQGEVVVSLCGSSYDTKLVVYDGAECPTTAPLACNDDGCGSSFESRVTIMAQSVGQMLMIRVGGFQGDQGDGFINILCDLDVCGVGSGDCFAAAGNGSRGCDDAQCCQTTCNIDPFCCDVVWDDFCAAEAAGLCSGSFDACVVDAGSCESGHVDGEGGCNMIDCCNTVCMIDPFCCVDTWDDICAQKALSACFLTCGGSSGGCFIPGGNGTPGCDDQACCEAVCTEDAFCCDTTWDENCVDMATALCR